MVALVGEVQLNLLVLKSHLGPRNRRVQTVTLVWSALLGSLWIPALVVVEVGVLLLKNHHKILVQAAVVDGALLPKKPKIPVQVAVVVGVLLLKNHHKILVQAAVVDGALLLKNHLKIRVQAAVVDGAPLPRSHAQPMNTVK
jgi:hypothetical protein